MRKREQRLWDRMRANMPPEIVLERIENVVGVGTPDVISLHGGFAAWTELKAVEELPARPTTPLLGNDDGLSIEQRNWHLNWNRNLGTTFVLIGVGAEQLMLPGWLADEINAMTFSELAVSSIAATWEEVARVLRGGTKQ